MGNRNRVPGTRDFQRDFCEPAMVGLVPEEMLRVALALDAAIMFGVLEYVDGNPSFQDLEAVRKLYEAKVARLQPADGL
jgi:hypothetical protein